MSDNNDYTLVKMPEPMRDRVEELGTEVVLFDEGDERSLINLVPESMRLAMKRLDPKLKQLTERQLFKKCEPDPVDSRIRLSFWDEYNLAQDQGRKMKIANILRGVANYDYWEFTVVKDPLKVAYICMPPKDYMVAMRSLLDQGVEKLQQILDLPLTDEKGKPNTRLIGEMVKIIQMIDLRIKGAVVQKINVNNRNLNVNVDGPTMTSLPTSMEEIEEKLRTVKKQLKALDEPKVETEALPNKNIESVIEGIIVDSKEKESDPAV